MSQDLKVKVIEAEERLRLAMQNNDLSVLEELLAPELLFTSNTGQLVSKADDLALHRSGLLRLEKLEPSQQRIQLHLDFAVVSVLMHLVGLYQNEPTDQWIRYTRVWMVSPGGVLQIVAGHMSDVQAA